MDWLASRRQGWQPLVVLLFIEFLFSRLSEPATFSQFISKCISLTPVNIELLLAIFLFAPVLILWLLNYRRLLKIFTIIYVVADTVRLLFAIFSLIPMISLFKGIKGADELLTDVIFIWFINVIVFGVWYWVLDAGGPDKRYSEQCDKFDFLFPQYGNEIKGWEKWKPDFIDYLFLAFSTSTTFGPTDTMVLSRRVKILMMIQVVASLTSFAVIAARAVTILK